MNIDALTLIFEFSNAIEIPLKSTTERGIVAHLAKISTQRVNNYHKDVECFYELVANLKKHFGEKKVSSYHHGSSIDHLIWSKSGFVMIEGYTKIDLDSYSSRSPKITIYGGIIDESNYLSRAAFFSSHSYDHHRLEDYRDETNEDSEALAGTIHLKSLFNSYSDDSYCCYDSDYDEESDEDSDDESTLSTGEPFRSYMEEDVRTYSSMVELITAIEETPIWRKEIYG